MKESHKRIASRQFRLAWLVIVVVIVVGVAALVVSAAPSASVATARSLPAVRFPSGITLEPTHQAIANSQATFAATAAVAAIQHPYQPHTNVIPQVPAHPTATLQAGIINEVVSPYRNVYIQNRWQGIEGDQIVTIFAGALKDDPEQGVVLINRDKINAVFGTPVQVQTLTRHGFLKITAVNGTVFTLVAKDGTMFTFDRSTATFK